MYYFGDIVRDFRMVEGLTSKELAYKLKVSPAYITKIELHNEIPKPELIIKIAKVLRFKSTYLLSQAKKEKIRQYREKLNRKYKVE
jgi:transcriptional regulator with XRE-family HTH domain